MRYAQLRAFHHVALCGGFSRAAERLCLTQPAISDQVRRLEAEYDTLLFDRSGNRAALTAKGAQLFDHTSRMFEAEDRAREFLTTTRSELTGRLRLIVDSARHVARLLGQFRKAHPKVQASLRSGNTDAVIRALMEYDADIGVGGNFPDDSRLEFMALGRSPVVAIAAADHQLASAGTSEFGELAQFPLVVREPGSKTRQIVEAAAAEIGIDAGQAMEAEGREAMFEIVGAGLGIGFVAENELPRSPGLARIRIADPRFVMEEKLVHLRNRRESPMIRSFMRAARQWKTESGKG